MKNRRAFRRPALAHAVMASLISSERRAPGRTRQVVLLSGRSLARLHGKAAREARFAGLFFQHRLILINDIWLGLAILGFCFLSCITVLMVESIHPGRERGGGTELGPGTAGPKVFCGRAVVMNSRFGASSGSPLRA